MQVRILELAVIVAMLGIPATSCKKGPEVDDQLGASEPNTPPASIRVICQTLQKRNRTCEKALADRFRVMAKGHLQPAPKPAVSLQGGALKRMQGFFRQQWIEQSMRELVRDQYASKDYFKLCAARLRDARRRGDDARWKATLRCSEIRECGSYVRCLDETGNLMGIRDIFARANKKEPVAKPEPEGPWRVATYLLSMAAFGDLFQCFLSATRPSLASKGGASKPEPRGMASCIAQVGARPRKCAAEVIAFAKAWVSKQIPTRPKDEQQVLKKLLTSETGPDAVKRLQANTTQAVTMMRNSFGLPVGKLLHKDGKKKMHKRFGKHMAVFRSIGACAKHESCNAYVACLGKQVQK